MNTKPKELGGVTTMPKELASYITMALVNHFDYIRPNGAMDMSIIEAERISQALIKGDYNDLQNFIMQKHDYFREYKKKNGLQNV